MIISHSRKFIFVHIHKAGGSSLERALDPYLAWNDLILGTTEIGTAMNDAYRNRFGLSDHSSVDEILDVCGEKIFDEYFSFALVRHPLDRIVSIYNYVFSLCSFYLSDTGENFDNLRIKMRNMPESDPRKKAMVAERPFFGWSITRAFLLSNDFSGFIRSPLAQSDTAFFPQVERLQSFDGGRTVDEVIKLEEAATKIPRLGERLSLTISLQRENVSTYRLIESRDVPPADRDYIGQMFEQDYLAFEYK